MPKATESESTNGTNGSSAGSSSSESNPKPAKRQKAGETNLKLNKRLCAPELMKQLQQAWSTGADFDDSALVKISSNPFTHVEISEFIQDEKLMSSLVEIMSDGTIFHDKASDLFQFQQSDDLKSIHLKEVEIVREFFEGQVLNFMTKLTGFPLNGTVDMFFSNYQRNDFLLCHDDELESRRIAFILYLSPEWKPEFGGSLDLFNSTEDIQPTTIAKSITPSYNKLVFFDVTCTSFHQVSEVLEPRVERFALSGWFYGEPIPRPQITFPVIRTYNLLDCVTEPEDSLENALTLTYADEDNYPGINEQLEEDSEVLLVDFLRPPVYDQLCQELTSLDWKETGPVNFCSYLVPNLKLWPDECSLNSTVQKLSKFFHSKLVLQFLEKITEFPFTSGSGTLVSSQLRKYKHRSYELLRSRSSDPKQNPKPAEDDGEDSEEEPTHVDLIYFFGEFEWDEAYGGLTVYNDAHGEQLITVVPVPNSLAVIVRGSSVGSYVNYVNSLAVDTEFCAYIMTFAFNGIL